MPFNPDIFNSLKSRFSHRANADQEKALKMLSGFLSKDDPADFFILTGSAGTGKTSLIQSITDYLGNRESEFFLAAPTGRSAKIISEKTGQRAQTLHSMLFTVSFDEESMQVIFTPKVNQQHEDIRYYVVDESSMISDLPPGNQNRFFQNVSLLKQLIRFVKSGNARNKIIFVGDKNQLPPVGSDFSPALASRHLINQYDLSGYIFNLTQVERHGAGSYILENAERILEVMKERGVRNPDIHYQAGYNFSRSIKNYLAHLENRGPEESLMIAHANAQVNALNRFARNFRFNFPGENLAVLPKELLISNHNTEVEGETIYKGTYLLIKSIWTPEEFAGLRFLNARVEFEKINGNSREIHSKIMLDSLVSMDGSIPLEKEKRLLHEAFRHNRKFRKTKDPRDDAFVNALRVRYGYAMTCHKAQGGEWNKVFLHQGYRRENLRWLYTAVTRAKSDLVSINNHKNN